MPNKYFFVSTIVLSFGSVCFSEDEPKVVLTAERAGAGSVSFSPDGKRLVTGTNIQGKSYLWDLESAKPIAELVGAGDVVDFAGFAAGGKSIVTVGLFADLAKTRILIWNGLSGAQTGEISVDLGTKAAITKDGKTLVTSNARRFGIQFYRLSDGQKLGEIMHPLPGGPDLVAIAPNSAVVAVCLKSSIWLGDTNNGAPKGKFETPAQIKSLAFSADSKLLVSACEDGSVQCWDLAPSQGLEQKTALERNRHGRDFPERDCPCNRCP